MSQTDVPVNAPVEDTLVVNEANDDTKVGEYVGQCKWFNDVYGYGFLTIQTGAEKGKDIFVHHSGISPLNSQYKTLKKGEYVNFNIINGDNGLQAVNVTGIGGGSLMCDIVPSIRKSPVPQQTTNAPQQLGNARGSSGRPHENGFIHVDYKKRSFGQTKYNGRNTSRGGRGGGRSA